MKPRRDLMILVAAVGVSAGGDIGAIAALAVHVQESTHSGLAVAGLFLANWLALAVAAPAGGALVDRADARGLLIAASGFQAVVAAALASTPGLPGVLALSVLLGVGGAIAVPAEFALVGAVAAQGPGAKRANARVETARNLGYLLGPLAGAGLVALWSVGATLAFDAVTFVAIGLGAALLTVRRPGIAPAGADRPRARDGIGLLTRDPVLRIAIAVLVGSLVAMSMSISADAFFVRQTLHTGPIGLGLLLSSWMVGMVLGSLVAAPRVAGGALAVAALLGTVVQGTGKLGAAAIAVLPVALALYAMGGAGHGVKNVAARALIHERVEPAAYGRAFATYAALRNCAELAALVIGGVLVDTIGARGTLLFAGAATAVIGLVGLARLAPLQSRYTVRREEKPWPSTPSAPPSY
jgi:MFS family permease